MQYAPKLNQLQKNVENAITTVYLWKPYPLEQLTILKRLQEVISSAIRITIDLKEDNPVTAGIFFKCTVEKLNNLTRYCIDHGYTETPPDLTRDRENNEPQTFYFLGEQGYQVLAMAHALQNEPDPDAMLRELLVSWINQTGKTEKAKKIWGERFVYVMPLPEQDQE